MRYTLQFDDGEPEILDSLTQFLADNYSDGGDLGSDEVYEMKNLAIGESFHGGGGAQPQWSITRDE